MPVAEGGWNVEPKHAQNHLGRVGMWRGVLAGERANWPSVAPLDVGVVVAQEEMWLKRFLNGLSLSSTRRHQLSGSSCLQPWCGACMFTNSRVTSAVRTDTASSLGAERTTCTWAGWHRKAVSAPSEGFWTLTPMAQPYWPSEVAAE